MNALVITVGDEIVLGQLLDTNSRWIAEELTTAGINVTRMVSVGDTESDIIGALRQASEKVILITGGLGPTSDDRTKRALCTHFQCELVFNEAVYEQMRLHFRGRSLADLERNKMQAWVPAVCEPIPNKNGTAPGMWFEDTPRIVSMPGVPEEMKAMMRDFVVPRLRTGVTTVLSHSFVMTAGAAESALAEKLSAFEQSLPDDVKLAYLPALGRVKLRLTSSRPQPELDRLARDAAAIIGEAAFSHGAETTLERHLGELLRARSQTLGTAESCTGGFLAHRITTEPGSSEYYLGSVVAYSNELKHRLLGVEEDTLTRFGAVSEETVKEMLSGLLQHLGVDAGKTGRYRLDCRRQCLAK
jgi:nicotinamide-nucleotide amidase